MTVSYSSWLRMLSDSAFEAGKTSPRHIHLSGRLQFDSGRLWTHAAHICSDTVAGGCSRLVRMMFGYIAPTSRW